ncbi:MAG: hypothetical protein ACLQVL_26785 [Terriglobia bacterium]
MKTGYALIWFVAILAGSLGAVSAQSRLSAPAPLSGVHADAAASAEDQANAAAHSGVEGTSNEVAESIQLAYRYALPVYEMARLGYRFQVDQPLPSN